jgi:RNA polymerase sigma-70 factor (ECF subfamily)
MAAVFDHYCEVIARYLEQGFLFESAGQQLRFDGLRHRDELHDAVAETFRRAFEERARLAYDGLKPYESYLRAIARNLVLDRLRGRSPSTIGEEATAELADRRASPEELAQRQELARLLELFGNTLDAVEGRFVTLRFEEGLSQQEVAARLKRTRRWVRRTEIDLRRRLLRHLRGTGYLPAAEEAAR